MLLRLFGYRPSPCASRRIAGISLVALFWTAPLAAAPGPSEPVRERESLILLLALPPDVTREDVLTGEQPTRTDLLRLASSRVALREGRESVDRVVILVDHAGEPILPDLDEARRHLIAGEAVRADPAPVENDLTFTYDSPGHPWTAAELQLVQTVVADFYPVIKQIYGPPAFDIAVNIAKGTFPYGGYYNPSTNEIVIGSVFQASTLAHEIVHAFRDDIVVRLDGFEEGMARAAEIEVFNALEDYEHMNEHHNDQVDVHYEILNRATIGSQDGIFDYGSGGLWAPRYELSGYAWAKARIEDSGFFAEFNAEYYSRAIPDPAIAYFEPQLVDIALTVRPTVEGLPFVDWYERQGVFETDPPKGYLLYQMSHMFWVYAIHRDLTGYENTLEDVAVQWEVYDHEEVMLDSGITVTGMFGFAWFEPALPDGYEGRLRVVVESDSPDGTVRDESFTPTEGLSGVFGVIDGENEGSVTIHFLENPTLPVTVPVHNGVFSAPWLGSTRGRFLAVFRDPAGRVVVRRFNKDASDYFVTLTIGTIVLAGDDRHTMSR